MNMQSTNAIHSQPNTSDKAVVGVLRKSHKMHALISNKLQTSPDK